MLSIVFSLWFEPDTSAAVYTEPIVSLVDHTDLSLSLNRIGSVVNVEYGDFHIFAQA